jgi:hypothetical protein
MQFAMRFAAATMVFGAWVFSRQGSAVVLWATIWHRVWGKL